MVARQLLAAGQKLAERVVEKQLDLVNEGRRLLPLSRGGLPPERTLVAPRQAEPLTQTRLPPLAGDSPGNIARAFAESARFRMPRTQQIQQEVTQVTPMDIVREMINEPSITLTAEDLPIINNPSIMMDLSGNLVTNPFAILASELPKKKKKKVSKYQKELGRQLKMLKKKHPRKKVTALMKQAHKLTRKALSK